MKVLLTALAVAALTAVAWLTAGDLAYETAARDFLAERPEDVTPAHLEAWARALAFKPWDGLLRKRWADAVQVLGEREPARRFERWSAAERAYVEAALEAPCLYLTHVSSGNLLRRAAGEGSAGDWAACYERALLLYPEHAELRKEYATSLYGASIALAMNGGAALEEAQGWLKRARQLRDDPFRRPMAQGVLFYVRGDAAGAWKSWAAISAGAMRAFRKESERERLRREMWSYSMQTAEFAVARGDWVTARRALDLLMQTEPQPGALLRDLARRFGPWRRELFGSDAAALTSEHFDAGGTKIAFVSGFPKGARPFRVHELEAWKNGACERLAVADEIPGKIFSYEMKCDYQVLAGDEALGIRVRLRADASCDAAKFRAAVYGHVRPGGVSAAAGWYSPVQGTVSPADGAWVLEAPYVFADAFLRKKSPSVSVQKMGLKVEACRDVCIDSMEWFLPADGSAR